MQRVRIKWQQQQQASYFNNAECIPQQQQTFMYACVRTVTSKLAYLHAERAKSVNSPRFFFFF